MYALLRSVYRSGDRILFQHLPYRWKTRAYALMFGTARRLFPERITARSAGQFADSAAHREAAAGRLPDWARGEVEALVAVEPLLSVLVTDGAPLEHYVIPWDMHYVGHRYALARRQLRGAYACMVLMGGELTRVDAARLDGCGRPLAIIDVDGASEPARLAQEVGADYVPLPAEELNMNDHCAVLARLVLQLAPRQVRHMPHPVVDECIKRHGLALASVAEVLPWDPGA